MGRSKSFTIYEDQGEKFRFSSIKFRKAVKTWQSDNYNAEGNKIPISEIEELIGEKVGLGGSAVKNWYAGHNGPGDVKMIKNVANFLGVPVKELSESTEYAVGTIGENFTPTSTEEKVLVKDMYRLFVEYIYWFVGREYENNASLAFEDPDDERDRFIDGLYKYLDSIALDVKNETFLNLRRTITELRFITEPHMDYWFPKTWIEINPYLGRDDFYVLKSDDVQDSFGVWYSDLIEDPEQVMHLFLEDMPELVDRAKELHEAGFEVDSGIGQTINSFRMDILYDTIELIVREATSTLAELMRKRFSDVL